MSLLFVYYSIRTDFVEGAQIRVSWIYQFAGSSSVGIKPSVWGVRKIQKGNIQYNSSGPGIPCMSEISKYLDSNEDLTESKNLHDNARQSRKKQGGSKRNSECADAT